MMIWSIGADKCARGQPGKKGKRRRREKREDFKRFKKKIITTQNEIELRGG